MNVDHKHVMIGQLYEQAWLGNQQVQALQAKVEGLEEALKEASDTETRKAARHSKPPVAA